MWRTFRNGQHLKTARMAAGLSQRALAQAAGVHVNSVKYWERADRFCAGWAVDLLQAVLADHGVSVETVRSDDGRKIAVVRAD
jgi:DNA-binding transcriptional regulator YiaG